MSAQSDQRKFIARLVAKGAVIEDGGQHLKIVHDGQLIAILPRRASSGGATVRAQRNTVAQARRAGLL
jgi:hypothetical protein